MRRKPGPVDAPHGQRLPLPSFAVCPGHGSRRSLASATNGASEAFQRGPQGAPRGPQAPTRPSARGSTKCGGANESSSRAGGTSQQVRQHKTSKRRKQAPRMARLPGNHHDERALVLSRCADLETTLESWWRRRTMRQPRMVERLHPDAFRVVGLCNNDDTAATQRRVGAKSCGSRRGAERSVCNMHFFGEAIRAEHRESRWSCTLRSHIGRGKEGLMHRRRSWAFDTITSSLS